MKNFVLFIVLSTLAACSSDTEGTDTTCELGEVFNPISRECEPRRDNPNNFNNADDGLDAATPDDVLEEPDLPPNPFLDMAADVPSDDRCAPDVDSDLDGLKNACECALGTDPARPDTDRDGLLDGQEDRNGSCRLDPGETDARSADTDGDGASDGDEVAAGSNPLVTDTDGDDILDGPEIASGCMDPTAEDSDGDSLPDGVEDFNADGQIGTCPNRMFMAACSNGESDPCKADTDGDGTPDNDEVQYLGCRPEDTAGLVDPQLLVSNPGDYKLALEPGVPTAAITGLNAHGFNDATAGYAGFVATFTTPATATTPELLSGHVFSEIRALFPSATLRSSGRRTTTHDGFQAIVNGVVVLPGGLKADTVRNQILGRLGSTSVNPNTAGTFSTAGAADSMLAVYQVVRRASTYVVTVAAVPESAYANVTGNAGFRVDDLTGGTSVARASETLEDECVSYRVDIRPKVDFIWVLDGSGSMSEEIAAVRSFANQFASILQASNLDWRVAVASGTCQNIDTDMAIDPSLRTVFGTGINGSCYTPPLIGLTPLLPNGKLCDKNGANFTTDVNKFKDCIDLFNPNGFVIAGELTATMGAAAISRAMPRSDVDNTKIRTDAAVVVISVTDEFDDHFQIEMGWRDAGSQGATPNDPTLDPSFDSARLDTVTQPFVDYFLRPDIGATLFGIYWIPGTPCTIASEASAGIHRMVQRTGGTAGSICQADISSTLQQIAAASAGIASGLRLRGVPAAPSIQVKVGQVSTQTIVDWTRSRSDGWDYDSIVNRVTFKGPNPPQTGDRVVIPYRRWAGSVRQCTVDTDCPQEQKYRCVDGVCI